MTKILIIGACGQIGTELTISLRNRYGNNAVIASDIREGNEELMQSGVFEILDATNAEAIQNVVEKHQITDVYLMAAMLSAVGEKFPQKAWDLNMNSLLHVLNLGRDKKIEKIFWPSSIAVFGPTTPKDNTPQTTIMEPTTVYGISKQAGERWCEYYYKKYGVDVRSIRYPGLISYKTLPGGGTTDYAVDIYHKAITEGKYTSFLDKGTYLPMMYMDDAIKATIDIMEAPEEKIRIRSSYNLSGLSFAPEDMVPGIKKHISGFTLSYAPDFRQDIADTWPNSVDDSEARKDWGWKPGISLDEMTKIMIENLKEYYLNENKI